MRAIGEVREDFLAQRQQRGGAWQLALEPVGEQREARPDIADDLGMGKKHLLDRRRHIADMDHLGPVRAHDERRLLDRVVADREDQIGLVDRLVDIVPLR